MTYNLSVTKRTDKGSKARTTQQIPGVVYGAGTKSDSINLNVVEFNKLFKKAGESSLIDLSIDGQADGKVLIQAVQFEPVKDHPIHVDLRRIDMNKVMTAPVSLTFVGEAPIIKSAGGTLVFSIETVEVKCLPKDLVSHIEVDISKLDSYEVTIKLSDIHLPPGIQITSPAPESLVVKAMAALTEDEIKAMEAAGAAPVDVAAIESAKPKKEGEEEGAEGAAVGDKGDQKEDKKDEKKEEKKDDKKK